VQADHGINRILTFSWAYNLFQDIVGATKARRWVSERFWHAQAGQKVVDIGCGPGSIVHLLPAGVKYVGFDISDEYISSARRKFAGDPDKIFLVGAAEIYVDNPPAQMQEADLVIINGLLHHLDDLEASFLISQAPMARWVLKQDRGKNVRSEPEWKSLVAQVFEKSDSYILTGLLRIPYTLIVIEARR